MVLRSLIHFEIAEMENNVVPDQTVHKEYMGESFSIIPEFRILRLTNNRKSASKS